MLYRRGKIKPSYTEGRNTASATDNDECDILRFCILISTVDLIKASTLCSCDVSIHYLIKVQSLCGHILREEKDILTLTLNNKFSNLK